MGGETPLFKPAAGLRRDKAAWRTVVLEWKTATWSEKLIDSAIWAATGTLLLYIFSMVAWPLFSSGFDLGHVQRVWHSWQALNVGMIALASSLLVFYSARYNERQRRKHEHIAAVAFLPRALIDLISYFEKSAELLNEAYLGQRGVDQEKSVPPLPDGYEQVFYRCIVGADNDLAGYLSSILSKLQIHHSRMTSSNFNPGGTGTVERQGIAHLMVHLAEIHAMVEKLFDYARFGEKKYRSLLTELEYRSSCDILRMHPERIREIRSIIDMRVKEYDPMEVT